MGKNVLILLSNLTRSAFFFCCDAVALKGCLNSAFVVVVDDSPSPNLVVVVADEIVLEGNVIPVRKTRASEERNVEGIFDAVLNCFCDDGRVMANVMEVVLC